jgi:hypothetical protein
MRPVGVDRKVKAGDPAERCRLFILFNGPVGRLFGIRLRPVWVDGLITGV